MNKKLVILLLFLLLIQSFVFANFSDVSSSHWAYVPITEMRNNDILNGYEDGTFKPDIEITRAEFGKIISVAFKLNSNNSGIRFDDVEGHWAKDYIANIANYMSYETNGNLKLFNPDGKAKREEVATALVKAMGLDTRTSDESGINKFTDKDSISDEYRKYVSIAVKNGIIRGFDDGTFKPQEYLTRAQVSQLVKNIYDINSKKLEEERKEQEAEKIAEKEKNKKEEEEEVSSKKVDTKITVKLYDSEDNYFDTDILEVENDETITIKASTNNDDSIQRIVYKLDNEAIKDISNSKASIEISKNKFKTGEHTLYYQAISKDSTATPIYTLKILLPIEEKQEPEIEQEDDTLEETDKDDSGNIIEVPVEDIREESVEISDDDTAYKEESLLPTTIPDDTTVVVDKDTVKEDSKTEENKTTEQQDNKQEENQNTEEQENKQAENQNTEEQENKQEENQNTEEQENKQEENQNTEQEENKPEEEQKTEEPQTQPETPVQTEPAPPAPTADRIHFISHRAGNDNGWPTGDAIILESNGHYGIVDLGNTYEKIANHVINYIKQLGIKKIDFILFTHMHSDHAGNFGRLAQTGIKIDEIWMKNIDTKTYRTNYKANPDANGIDKGLATQKENTDYTVRNKALSRFRRVIHIANYSKYKDNIGPIWYISNEEDGVTRKFQDMTLKFYNVKRNANAKLNENHNSIATLVTVNGHKILLTGDFYDTKMFNSIAKKIKKIDVLKVPHHGYSTSALLPVKYNGDKVVESGGTTVKSTAISSLKPKYFVITNSKERIASIRSSGKTYTVDVLGEGTKYWVDANKSALILDVTGSKISFTKK